MFIPQTKMNTTNHNITSTHLKIYKPKHYLQQNQKNLTLQVETSVHANLLKVFFYANQFTQFYSSLVFLVALETLSLSSQ